MCEREREKKEKTVFSLMLTLNSCDSLMLTVHSMTSPSRGLPSSVRRSSETPDVALEFLSYTLPVERSRKAHRHQHQALIASSLSPSPNVSIFFIHIFQECVHEMSTHPSIHTALINHVPLHTHGN